MKYQVIGDNNDGTVTVRIYDGENTRDEIITLPPPVTQDDQIADAVRAKLNDGLKGEIVSSEDILPDGTNITNEGDDNVQAILG